MNDYEIQKIRDTAFCSGYNTAVSKYEKQNKELQKENAELKERLKEHESVGNEQFWKNVWSWKTKADQLTKAKEIIKTFLGFAEAFGYSPSMDKFITEAEQFLNEVEK